MAFTDPKELLKLGYGGAYPNFMDSQGLEGLLGEATEYNDEGVFEGLVNRFRKDDSDVEDISTEPLSPAQLKSDRMDSVFSSYKKAMTEARASKAAYDSNPDDPSLRSMFDEKDAAAQYYENQMREVGWGETIPNVGDVIDKENFMIYSSEEDMANKIGGRPIYTSKRVTG